MKPTRILVTGGAGFIGSHTVQLLLAKQKEVLVLDNLSSGRIENLDLQHPNLEFIEGDILEYPLLEELVKKVDAVLHLAAVASVPLSIENPIYTFQVNTQGVLHILEAMRKTARHLPLVYASSAAVYGNTCDLPCRDDVPLARALLSPYALQKLQAEDYALLYAKSHHLPSLGLRYFNVYGTRQDPHSSYSGVISRFLAAYRQQENFKVFGDGLQLRDFIAVQDVAAANLLALESGYHGVLNIATGVPHSVLNLVDFFCGIEQKNIKVDFLPERSGDIQASYGSNTLALQHLGFSYHTDLQTGIKSLVL